MINKEVRKVQIRNQSTPQTTRSPKYIRSLSKSNLPKRKIFSKQLAMKRRLNVFPMTTPMRKFRLGLWNLSQQNMNSLRSDTDAKAVKKERRMPGSATTTTTSSGCSTMTGKQAKSCRKVKLQTLIEKCHWKPHPGNWTKRNLSLSASKNLCRRRQGKVNCLPLDYLQ